MDQRDNQLKNNVRYIASELIEDIIHLPNNVLGYLDWSTGLIRVNISFKLYQRIQDGPEFIKLRDTLVHEMFHAYQICNSGYLYNFILEFTHELYENVIKIGRDDLLEYKAFFHEIELTPTVYELLEGLNEEQNSLTIMDLVEGQAFLAHNLIVDHSLTTDGYDKIANRFVGTPYTNLYFYLRERLGSDAFYFLGGLCYAALLFESPLTVLAPLIERVTKIDTYSFVHDISILENFIDMLARDTQNRFLGWPISLVESNKPLQPYYSSLLHYYAKNYSRSEITSYMINPRRIPSDFHNESMRPLIFSSTDFFLPNNFNSPELKDYTEDDYIDSLKVMSALSFKAMNGSKSGPSFFEVE